jgi:hypothetical protein
VLALVLGAGTALSFATSAQAAGAFEGAASADGVRIGLIVPGAPVADQLVDLGGPSTQARLESLGTSRAFASFPYPGDLTVGLPGLVAGFTGGSVPLPTYPLYVAADHPSTPNATLEAPPGYRISADAGAESATSTATAGLDGSDVFGAIRARTTAAVTTQDGSVVAEARSETDAIAIGPLRIGSVRTFARATLGSDGSTTLERDIEVGGLTVEGLPVAIGPHGLTLASSTLPVPALDSLPGDALATAGVSLELLEPTEHNGTVTAPMLRIGMAGADVPGSGPTRLTATIGGAAASVSGVAPKAPAPPILESPAAPHPGPALGFAGPAPGPAISAPTSPTPPPAPAAVDARRVAIGFDVAGLYLLVAGLGVAGALASHLVRMMGVRMPWTS